MMTWSNVSLADREARRSAPRSLRGRAIIFPILAGASGFAATLAAATSPDPWAKVPPLSTACYQSSNDFPAKLEAAKEAIALERERQEKINSGLTERVKSIDPMELASRQQQYMMEHPQEAMALMQANQHLGETFSDTEVRNAERKLQFSQELEGLDRRYKTALDKALAPVTARFKDLDVRAMKDPLVTEAGDFYKPWAVKEYNALVVEENGVYDKVCAEWWSTSGPYHAWLARYKELLVRDQIPVREEADRVGVGFMVQAVGTPSESYKSLATFDAIVEYLKQVGDVLDKRRPNPKPPME